MKFNDKTDYSLRVIIYLLRKKKKVKIQEIADFYKISKNHLKVIVNELGRLEIISTLSGPTGGIFLNASANSYPLGMLITQLEQMNITECFNKKNNSCVIDGTCRLKYILRGASKIFVDTLNQYTINDLE